MLREASDVKARFDQWMVTQATSRDAKAIHVSGEVRNSPMGLSIEFCICNDVKSHTVIDETLVLVSIADVSYPTSMQPINHSLV